VSHLIISCVDGRIRDRLSQLEERLGEEDPLWLMVPGGPLIFSESRAEADAVLGWIDTLTTRQGVHKIVLVSHQQCLAFQRKYGGFFHDEMEVIARDLARAKQAILDRFYGIHVDCFVVPWDSGSRSPGFSPAKSVIPV
jgi:hypothetical protein